MPYRDLKDLRVLVTGASQGIGRAIAIEAATRGCKVLAAARSQKLLDELAAEVRGKGLAIETIAADVTKPEDRQAMADAAQNRFGGLDVLINNAGIGATGHFAECSPERLRKIMEVNFFGLTETTRACLPLLRQGVRPAIVNISSIAGKRAIPARSEYSASKFAVQGFSEALRADDVSCPNCGITFREFREHGRFGCPLDYDVFKEQLIPLLENIHGETEHAGKVPKSAPAGSQEVYELIKLRRELAAAIEQEEYETAATLRDRIQAFETKSGRTRTFEKGQ